MGLGVSIPGRSGGPREDHQRTLKLCLIVSFIRDNRGSSVGPKVGREQRKQRLYGGTLGRRDNERVTKEVKTGVTSGQPVGRRGSSSGRVNGFRKILLTPIGLSFLVSVFLYCNLFFMKDSMIHGFHERN